MDVFENHLKIKSLYKRSIGVTETTSSYSAYGSLLNPLSMISDSRRFAFRAF